MKTFKFTYLKSSKVSKAERILDIFRSNPDEVIDLRECKKIFDEYYDDEISLSAISLIISRIWKKKLLLRTPTQLDSGYFYTFSNNHLLDKIYKIYLLLYDFENDEVLVNEILKDKFNKLPSNFVFSNLDIEQLDFVSKYNLNYIKRCSTLSFLASNVAFLMCDGHITKNKQQISYYFRYEKDAILFRNDFKNIFFDENVQVRSSSFCYKSYLCSVSFAQLMHFLGAPLGKKTLQPFFVPDWIYYGSDKIKKSFLATALGNEGSAPSDNKWRIQFVLSKCKEEVPNLLFFINQIRRMLFHFGIFTSHIQLRTPGGNRKFHARFYIKGKENLFKFYKLLKFNYASEKQEILEDLLRRHSYIN